MIQLLSALCAGMAAWLWFSSKTPTERLARLHPQTDAPRTPTTPHPQHPQSPISQSNHHSPDGNQPPPWLTTQDPRCRPSRKTLLMATCTGLISGLLIGGYTGLATAIVITPATALVLHRKEPQQSHHDRRRITTDLPFAADLMTACLRAGRPVSIATEITATAIGGPLGERLTWVSSQLRLGADPEPTWAALAADPAMGQLSRAMSRAAQSGAPVADVLTRLADDAREAARATSVAAARSVGVKAVAPLGLCFLPAFVLLGIIPVIAGLASTITLP